ncbi:hypothetical protein FSP39_017303 [Pinctada imbricata]|uniref:IgGFc-binding protein N-terminal domain-containing protein n=1 Tax=Pinctada imbricata TaxID=66713 RepID=A0AA89BPH9_PINIB|nr:hypothetical protein FSP39_017303 [Pinctada imbricata]
MNLTFDRELEVRRQEVTTIEVPGDFKFLGNEIAVKSVRVTSDRKIFVYAANARTYSGDMFLAYPTNKIGQNYIVAAIESDVNVHENVPVVAVAAVNYDTLVTFHFKSSVTIAFTNGETFSGNVYRIELNQYEVVHIKHFELSGIMVTANKDIVVVSGNTFFRDASYYGRTTGDHVAEQLVPLKYMSKKYIVVPSSTNDTESGEIVRIYSTESETNVIREYDGSTTPYTLHNAGDSIDFFLNLSSASIFTADKDISVVQFGMSSTQFGDPYMLLTTPLAAFMSSYEFSTPSNYNYGSILHRLVLIANNIAIESTFLDTAQLTTEWTPVGEYFFINVPISEGAHMVHTSVEGGALWGFIYGRRKLLGYASSIGRFLCETGNCPVKYLIAFNFREEKMN